MNDHNYNLFSHFQQQFQQQADKVLLCTNDNISYRYKQIDELSLRYAQTIKNLGINVGDRVTVQVEKSPQAFALYLACLRAGYVFHPLNTGYQVSELEYFLGNAGPSLVVCDSAKKSVFESLLAQTGIPHLLTLDVDGQGSLTQAAAEVDIGKADTKITHRDKDDLAALLYSSGTTGVPKGIMLSHNNLLHNAQSLVDAWGFNSEDVLLHALPIFHVHGLFVGLGCVLLSGASMRWLPAFHAPTVIKILPECSVMMGVPTYYTRLLASPDFQTKTVSSIRLFVSGSAPLLAETFEEFEQRTGNRILERYGMTETNMNTSNPLHGLRKPGTVGLPLPGVSVRVTDDNNIPLNDGEIGNLQVKGENVFKGYWNMPEKTAEDFTPDGFFNTGDKAMIDEDAYVSIVGRAKDLVITGGLNVYPKEVELVIDDMGGVKESAVIGITHNDFGEAVVAVIVKSEQSNINENDVITTVKGQLANFKVPKRVMFIESLPRNTMGKVQKNILRDQFEGLFT